MLETYLQYLTHLNKGLNRRGIVLPVNLNCDNGNFAPQVTIMEQFFYFNDVLLRVDSSASVNNLLGFINSSVDEFLRSRLLSEYEAEWLEKERSLLKQPSDAGVLPKTITQFSKGRVIREITSESVDSESEDTDFSEEV